MTHPEKTLPRQARPIQKNGTDSDVRGSMADW